MVASWAGYKIGSLTGEPSGDKASGISLSLYFVGEMGGERRGIGPGARRESEGVCAVDGRRLLSCENEPTRGGSGGDIRLLMSSTLFEDEIFAIVASFDL